MAQQRGKEDDRPDEEGQPAISIDIIGQARPEFQEHISRLLKQKKKSRQQPTHLQSLRSQNQPSDPTDREEENVFDFSAYLDEPPGTVMPVSSSAGCPLRAFLTLYGHAITRGGSQGLDYMRQPLAARGVDLALQSSKLPL